MRLLALALVLLLAGCASTPVEYEVDHAYVARVEQGAKLGGGSVHWVNYPTVRKTASPS